MTIEITTIIALLSITTALINTSINISKKNREQTDLITKMSVKLDMFIEDIVEMKGELKNLKNDYSADSSRINSLELRIKNIEKQIDYIKREVDK